jgi:site-specific DNA recombinase
MVKDPDCKNKNWKAAELESYIEGKIRELLSSPKMAAELATHKPKIVPPKENISIEKRIREIDKQIGKLMELYQRDGIPAELLGENINKLYNEKTALQSAITVVPEAELTPFDLVEELIADAAQIWEFADEPQKRRIMQGLISRIVLTENDIKIEWAF